jgi:hypothetical protein
MENSCHMLTGKELNYKIHGRPSYDAIKMDLRGIC